MPVRLSPMNDFHEAVEDAVYEALLELAWDTHDLYFQEVTKVTEPGPPFDGPHSLPGGYPFRETGIGAQSILVEAHPPGSVGVGLTEDGLHLQELVSTGRLGIRDAFNYVYFGFPLGQVISNAL